MGPLALNNRQTVSLPPPSEGDITMLTLLLLLPPWPPWLALPPSVFEPLGPARFALGLWAPKLLITLLAWPPCG